MEGTKSSIAVTNAWLRFTSISFEGEVPGCLEFISPTKDIDHVILCSVQRNCDIQQFFMTQDQQAKIFQDKGLLIGSNQDVIDNNIASDELIQIQMLSFSSRILLSKMSCLT